MSQPGDTVAVVSPHPRTKRNPLGAGRSPRAGEPSSNVTIRLTDSERERYQAAAAAADLTLGEWLRAAAEAMLKRGKRRA